VKIFRDDQTHRYRIKEPDVLEFSIGHSKGIKGLVVRILLKSSYTPVILAEQGGNTI
jgi:hypothetical protein